MCPGGKVVNASSEENRLCTNGMSEFARNEENSNAALLVGITPADYQSENPLAGMYFQRELEHKAFVAGGENFNAPVPVSYTHLFRDATFPLRRYQESRKQTSHQHLFYFLRLR